MKMKIHHSIARKLKVAAATITIMAGLAMAGPAQTNTQNTVDSKSAPQEPSPRVVKIADDVRQLVIDLGGGISWSVVIQGLFVAYLTAKGLRNKTALGTAGGWLSTALNLINLERNSPPAARPGTSQPQTQQPT
ncbi:MAG: hypothetical protein ABSE16_01575 [Verrucomicrobiota bacterium]|jgi:hypothetical protein